MKLNVQNSELKTTLVFWLSLLILLLAAIALRAKLLNSFPLSPDEGIHLMWLRLLSAGYQPYTEVYITYPPLYPLAIEAVWKIWPIETAQRWFSVLYTLFGAVGIALLARKLAGAVAGVAAAALTLFSPVLVEPSRAILAEFPSVSWSVWAIWLAWLASDESASTLSAQPPRGTAQRVNESPFRRRILLILSGLCLAASLLTKLLSPFVAILIPLILMTHWYTSEITNNNLSIANYPFRTSLHASRFTLHVSRLTLLKSLLIDLAIWSLALLLPVLILISAFNVESLVNQVVDQRLGARAATTAADPFWPPRYERGAMFVQEDTALVVLGLIGMGMAWARRQKDRWLMLTWLALALGMLMIHNPIRYKHYLILIPPLAIFGGIAIAHWILDFRFWILGLKSPKSPSSNPQAPIIAITGLILLISLYAWQIPATLKLWQAKADVPQPPPDEVEALAFIEAVTAPGDCLISDDMPLLYWSGRLAPPELAEVSTNRLESGTLTTPELIAISDRHDCQLVMAVTNRITKYLPDYMDWVKHTYLGRFHYGEDDLYFAKVDTDPRPATPLWADFNGQIIFHGYSLSSSSPSPSKGGVLVPGDRVSLTLIWQAQTRLDTDYAIFVQLRDMTHTTLANADHQPYLGLVPTSKWPVGGVIQEVTWLDLPEDIPPGSYNIYVGLYHPDNLERLPLQGDTSGENALILGPLEVQ